MKQHIDIGRRFCPIAFHSLNLLAARVQAETQRSRATRGGRSLRMIPTYITKDQMYKNVDHQFFSCFVQSVRYNMPKKSSRKTCMLMSDVWYVFFTQTKTVSEDVKFWRLFNLSARLQIWMCFTPAVVTTLSERRVAYVGWPGFWR